MVILPRGYRTVVLVLLWGPLALVGCAGGQNVTPDAIQAAQKRWERAAIHDYDLEWRSSGARSAHYFVKVRNDDVRSIESIDAHGQRHEVHLPERSSNRFYGVEGLFTVINDELKQLSNAQPFGQPKGS